MRKLVALVVLLSIGGAPVAAVNCSMIAPGEAPTEHDHGVPEQQVAGTDIGHASTDSGNEAGPRCVMIGVCAAAGPAAPAPITTPIPPTGGALEWRPAGAAAITSNPTQDPPPPRLSV